MKKVILMALMITSTQTFAMSFKECADMVSEGAFVNKAGEIFGEKLGKAIIASDEAEIEKGTEIMFKAAEALNDFCEYTVEK